MRDSGRRDVAKQTSPAGEPAPGGRAVSRLEASARCDTVLIIPGLNGHPGLLMASAPTLFADWRVLAFNHHQDEAEGGVEGMARRAFEFLDQRAEPVGRVFVCGESFGGTVALTMAHLQPQRVAGLILLSTFGWHPSSLARRGVGALAGWSYLGQHIGNGVYRVGRVASLPTQLGLRFPSELFWGYIARPRAHLVAYRKKAELSLTFDARPWLGTLECPTFVLTGSWDPIVPASAGRELARRIPHASLHRVRGGHLVHLVQAKRVGKLIADWARSSS